MPGKKKKYNARFPPARIKKIMQSDEEVGKVAAPVPVIISRALEMFAETLLGRAKRVTAQRGARTLTPSHLKFCINSESRFDFLKDLVSTVPDLQGDMDNEAAGVVGNSMAMPEPRSLGLSSGRGRGRGASTTPSTPRPPGIGTGKRRGRPPKIPDSSILPGATSKRMAGKFVDDEYDCEIMDDDEEGEDYDEIKEPTSTPYTNGVVNYNADSFSTPASNLASNLASNPPPSAHQNLPFNRSHSVPQGKVQLQFGPTTDTASLRYPTFSSPYNVQRSVSNQEFQGISFGGFQGSQCSPPVRALPSPPVVPSTPSTFPPTIKNQEQENSSQLKGPSMDLSRGPAVFSEKLDHSAPRQSLPPPAPVYSGSHSRQPNVGSKPDVVPLYPGYRVHQPSINNSGRVNSGEPRVNSVSKNTWVVPQNNQINAFSPPVAKNPQTPGAPNSTESPLYSFSTSNNTFSLKSGTNGTFTMAPLFPGPNQGQQQQTNSSSNNFVSRTAFGVHPTQNAQLNPASRQELDEDYDC